MNADVTGTGETPGGQSRRRQRLFALFTLSLSLSASLFAAEWFLSYQRQTVELSDRLEPGMILYDPRLGWRLKPNWFGSHKHYDFDVNYNINRFGFRGRPPTELESRRYAVVGDSFSFGQGVNDEQTFVHLLDEADKEAEFLNFSVPGYSTDQQYLLIRDRVRLFKPDVLVLVVYLGNDLFDNERPYPLQGDHAKPYFRMLPDGGLALQNTPVPMESKPAAARGESLTSLVLGESQPPPTMLQRWLGGFEIVRRLGLFQSAHQWDDRGFEMRFSYHLKLFQLLVGRVLETTREWQAEFKLVLLPGRSFVEKPNSLSAGYQDFLRKGLLRDLSAIKEVEVVDLAIALCEARDAGSSGLYYPNEGHLSPAGHVLVARLLNEHLWSDREKPNRQ